MMLDSYTYTKRWTELRIGPGASLYPNSKAKVRDSPHTEQPDVEESPPKPTDSPYFKEVSLRERIVQLYSHGWEDKYTSGVSLCEEVGVHGQNTVMNSNGVLLCKVCYLRVGE